MRIYFKFFFLHVFICICLSSAIRCEGIPYDSLRRLSFKESICGLWKVLGIMRYRSGNVYNVYYDGTAGRIPSMEYASLTCLYFFKYGKRQEVDNSVVRQLEVDCYENPSNQFEKAVLILQGIEEAESISSLELAKRTAILALTQSLIGEIIVKYFAIPRILKYCGVPLVNECNKPKPIITFKTVPVINTYDAINYSYNILQYVLWFKLIRWKNSDSDIRSFLTSIIFRLGYDVAFNCLIHSAELSCQDLLKKLNNPDLGKEHREIFFLRNLFGGGFFMELVSFFDIAIFLRIRVSCYSSISTARAGAASVPMTSNGRATNSYLPGLTCPRRKPSIMVMPAFMSVMCVGWPG